MNTGSSMKEIKINGMKYIALIDRTGMAWYLDKNDAVMFANEPQYEFTNTVSKETVSTNYSDYLTEINKTLESISMLKPKKITMEF
jgi:hypothetical protein